jgi:hypothetical protein
MTLDPRYPIGKVQLVDYSEKERDAKIADILFLPRMLEYAVLNLDESQIQTPYRDGGWTVHQLIHHLADSHMNSFIRFKLALTEENPVIKPYLEDKWSKLADVSNVPINISITLLHALHHRWHRLLESMTEDDFKRTVFHPEKEKDITLWDMLLIYAWHGKHHVAHITTLREQNSW